MMARRIYIPEYDRAGTVGRQGGQSSGQDRQRHECCRTGRPVDRIGHDSRSELRRGNSMQM